MKYLISFKGMHSFEKSGFIEKSNPHFYENCGWHFFSISHNIFVVYFYFADHYSVVITQRLCVAVQPAPSLAQKRSGTSKACSDKYFLKKRTTRFSSTRRAIRPIFDSLYEWSTLTSFYLALLLECHLFSEGRILILSIKLPRGPLFLFILFE